MNPDDTQVLNDALANLKLHHKTSKLQAAIGLLISSQIIPTNMDVIELQKAFAKLDIDQDGKISSEELLQGYEEVFNQTVTSQQIEEILRLADTDGSGALEYDEFIAAAMNPQKLYSKKNLIKAFKLFDTDNSGTISVNEIREAIGPDLATDEVWKKLMASADADGSGEIDLQEFQKLFMND